MGEITWSKALEEFKMVGMPARNLAPRTRIEYENDVQGFIYFLDQGGMHRVGEISTRQVDRYLARLEEQGIIGATRKRKAITIRSFLNFLFRSGYLCQDISRQVILPFAEANTPRFLTKSEYELLLAACADNLRDTAIVTLILQTGIRLSELLRLTQADVEIGEQGKGEIRIANSNGRKGRVIPLNAKAGQAVHAYLQSRKDNPQPRVFLSYQGKPLGSRGVEKRLAKYCQLADIWRASPHSLRHTFGVQHIIKGTSVKTIQQVMGHQDIRTTENYVPLANELVKKELEDNAL